jgi:4-amino-4-deoxy-L-arabinose transferase-like glycosyltransferase
VAFGIAAFWLLLFRSGRAASMRGSVGLGAAFGALLLINPAPLSMLPAALWFLVAHHADARAKARAGISFMIAAFLVCLPWLVRNQRELGAFTLRTNLGIELNIGNNDLARGYPTMSLHPSTNADEYLRYRALGEVPYAAWAMHQAKNWILEHPLRFVVLTVHRAQLVWFGEPPPIDPREEPGVVAASDMKSWIKWVAHMLGGALCLFGAWRLARARTEGRYLLAVLMLFPVPYYLTHTMERYRFPIEPLIVFMVAWLVIRCSDRWRSPRSRLL